MPNLSCRYHEKELPEEGELVVGKVSEVTDMGVFIEIIEYDNLEGLIVVGELTRKRINTDQKTVKKGKLEVLFVSRIDKRKKYVDLSRIKVSDKERENCLMDHHKRKLAHNIMTTVAKKVDVDLIDLYREFGWPKTKEFGMLYDFFIMAQSDPSVLKDLKYENEILDAVNLRIKISKIKISADIKVGCNKKLGVIAIRKALMEANEEFKKVEISLIKPPMFCVSITTENPKTGLSAVETVCLLIKSKIEKFGGYFNLENKPVVYGLPKNVDEDNVLIEDSSL